MIISRKILRFSTSVSFPVENWIKLVHSGGQNLKYSTVFISAEKTGIFYSKSICDKIDFGLRYNSKTKWSLIENLSESSNKIFSDRHTK